MEITQTTQTTNTTAASAASGAAAISSDFDTFLQMMTAQIQNQDPLNPIESTDFAVQLATFSGVEQQVLTNDLLTQLTTNNSVAGLADLASWVGQEVRAPSFGYWGGSNVTIATEVADGATDAQLLIRNEFGAEVYRDTIPTGSSVLLWDGKDSSGNTLAHGTYQFDVVNMENGLAVSEQPAEVYSRVVEVRAEDGAGKIILEGGASVLASDITALRQPS